jgi:DNA-binding response OmpR family regulator
MNTTKPVILCIDDDADFLDSLQIIIESRGYVFERAGSAEDGVRRSRELKPDLIIVDLMMEEVDSGVNFVKDIKAAGDATPIYLLSSVGDNLNISTDYTRLGLAGVFQKPINPEVLLATLDRRLKAKP